MAGPVVANGGSGNTQILWPVRHRGRSQMMISVVIPALNEQDQIGETVTRVRAVLSADGFDAYEIVVVDDGSSDETGARAEQAGARVLRHPHNVGYGRSLKDGIRAARYETIVISDADGTYPIEAI